MIPIVCMNIYVVGLNQLYDVEIDKVVMKNMNICHFFVIHIIMCSPVHVSKVNKPDLPIASGEYSMEMGKAIVSAFGLMVSNFCASDYYYLNIDKFRTADDLRVRLDLILVSGAI